MYSYDRSDKVAAEDLWVKAQEDIRVFNDRYAEVHRLFDTDNSEGLDKILNDFAFRKNGTAPSFPGTNFRKWMDVAFRPGDVDDPESSRPQGVVVVAVIDGEVEITAFFEALDSYRDDLQAVLNATAPLKFTYQGFQIDNPQHMGDAFCRRILEGVDYVTALFKKRGLEKLLKNEVTTIGLLPTLGNALGYYYANTRSIQLSGQLVGMGSGRFTKWVNEAFLHEFGHHVHLNYITGEAREVWDSGWAEVKSKQEAIETAFKKITHPERMEFNDVLYKAGWDPSKAAKKLNSVQKVKFGVWLRQPMIGEPLITDRQFRLTKRGQDFAKYFMDPYAYIKDRYGVDVSSPDFQEKNDFVVRQKANVLGLMWAGAYAIPSAVVEDLAKSDPSMQQAVDEALEKLEIVSAYGKTNEKEDFAETFVAFVDAPEKLTPTSKFRMQKTLSVSGLYGKPVMRLAERVAERFKAESVVPFKPKKPSGPTLPIGGKKYVLSDYFPMLSDMAEESIPGGAKFIRPSGGPRFSYLWAYDIDKKSITMWRVSDGDEKAGGSAHSYMSEVIVLEKKGQLNRVTHEEMNTLERFMANKQKETLKSLKKYLEENADEWDRESKRIAAELWERKFLPRILSKFKEIEQGVIPFGFKFDSQRYRSQEDQAKMFVATNITAEFTLKVVDEYARTKGYDPDNPPGDLQALDWARQEVLDDFFEEHFR